jgi:hypothetical protein
MHGPLVSTGINFLSSELYRSPEERKTVAAAFDASENIRALSYIFKNNDFKIVYSGWMEDEVWLTQNSSLFDALTIQSQTELSSTVEFAGRKIQNNKEKLYFSIHKGMMEIEKYFKEDCTVLRMRSDIAIDIRKIKKCLSILSNYPDSIMIEYANPRNPYFVPDFLTLATLKTHLKLYSNLLDVYYENGGYHISSHIDHGIEFLGMQSKGELSDVICMEREVHDSMVWRGLPRYYAFNDGDISADLLFNCLINYPPNDTVPNILANMHPDLTGRHGQ